MSIQLGEFNAHELLREEDFTAITLVDSSGQVFLLTSVKWSIDRRTGRAAGSFQISRFVDLSQISAPFLDIRVKSLNIFGDCGLMVLRDIWILPDESSENLEENTRTYLFVAASVDSWTKIVWATLSE